MMVWVECQNDECKFRTSGFDKGKERRKRIVSAHLEGSSQIKAECPVCHQYTTWIAEPENMGILITGNKEDLVKGIREAEKYVFQEHFLRTFIHRAMLAADEVIPKKEQIVTNVVDKPVAVVLDNIFGKK